MALMFGEQLTDVSEDEAALAEFLDAARAREGKAAAQEPALQADPYQGEFESDPEPEYQGEGLEEKIIPEAMFEPVKGRAVSARMQKDIQAKTAMLLLAGGTVWKSRDEYCGGVFVDAIPEVSSALTAIFCDSPDIVRWFTASGKYMKWLDLLMVLQPIGQALVQHHVTHSVSLNEEGAPQQADWSIYSARG